MIIDETGIEFPEPQVLFDSERQAKRFCRLNAELLALQDDDLLTERQIQHLADKLFNRVIKRYC